MKLVIYNEDKAYIFEDELWDQLINLIGDKFTNGYIIYANDFTTPYNRFSNTCISFSEWNNWYTVIDLNRIESDVISNTFKIREYNTDTTTLIDHSIVIYYSKPLQTNELVIWSEKVEDML